jgi:Type II secretion system (T2SS), protein M
MDRLLTWWSERARREQVLLLVAFAVLAVTVGLRATAAVQADLAALRRRVAVAEHDLRAVRGLAGRVGRGAEDGTPPTALMPYLETVADATVGRERIAAMTPVMASGAEGEQVSLRIVETSLENTVRLLHALESGSRLVRPTALHLIEHPSAPGVFDAVVEVARREALP